MGISSHFLPFFCTVCPIFLNHSPPHLHTPPQPTSAHPPPPHPPPPFSSIPPNFLHFFPVPPPFPPFFQTPKSWFGGLVSWVAVNVDVCRRETVAVGGAVAVTGRVSAPSGMSNDGNSHRPYPRHVPRSAGGQNGMEFKGGRTNAIVTGNFVTNTKGSGLVFADGSKAAVDDNDIANNMGHGVRMGPGCAVTLRGNRIYSNDAGGIHSQEAEGQVSLARDPQLPSRPMRPAPGTQSAGCRPGPSGVVSSLRHRDYGWRPGGEGAEGDGGMGGGRNRRRLGWLFERGVTDGGWGGGLTNSGWGLTDGGCRVSQHNGHWTQFPL